MNKVARSDGNIFCEACGDTIELRNYRMHMRYVHTEKKEKQKKEYVCHICFKTFTSNYNLQYHLSHHYNLKNFQCDQCNNAYNTKADLAQHKRTHDKARGTGSYGCYECGEFFATQHKLDVHLKKIHMKINNVFECTICNRSFTTKWSLKEHNKSFHSTDRQLFKCEECDKAFTMKYSLKIHVDVTHRGLKQYDCIVCGKSFGNPKDRRKHELLHERGRNSTYCTYCKKYVHDDIVQHDQIVHSEFEFSCSVCNRKFPSSHDQNRHHLAKHVNSSYVCDICGLGYANKYYLRCHLKTHFASSGNDTEKEDDGNLKALDCKICGKHFKYPRSVVRHILSVHEKIKSFECDICGKKFSDKGDLNKHRVKIHENEGKICRICKFSVENMKEHYEIIHSDLQFPCQSCPLRFKSLASLQYHKNMKHTGVEMKYCCSTCGEEFQYEALLTKHEKTHQEEEEEEDQKVEINNAECKVEILTQYPDIHNIDVKKEVINDDYQEENVFYSHEIKQEPSDNDDIETRYEEDWLESEDYSEDDKPLKKPKKDKESDTSQVLSRYITKIPLEKDGKKLQVRCKICCATFSTVVGYRDHFFEAHAEDDDEFECKECKKSFSDKKKLQEHFRSTHQNFKCQNCKRGFASEYLLERHMSKHHELKSTQQLMCTLCGKIYANHISLNAHMDAIHNQCRFQCEICEKSYSFKSALYKHRQLAHFTGKTQSCPQCPYMAATKREIQLHLKNQHDLNKNIVSDFYCPACNRYFSNGSTLKRHLHSVHDQDALFRKDNKCVICFEPLSNNYVSEKHFAQVHLNGKIKMRKCGHCKMEFKLYTEFSEHIKSHPGVYICITCGMPFYAENLLNGHILIHRHIDKRAKNYSCDHCGHRTFSKNQMKIHVSKHMTAPQLHTCDVCGKVFKIASSLYTHRKYHQEGTIPCSYCGLKFVRNSDLEYHIRKEHTHEKPFKCSICGQDFLLKSMLKAHLQSHPQTMETYECKECNISFGIKKKDKEMHDHVVHPEKRPYRCFICNLSFKHQHNLESHNRKHLG